MEVISSKGLQQTLQGRERGGGGGEEKKRREKEEREVEMRKENINRRLGSKFKVQSLELQ